MTRMTRAKTQPSPAALSLLQRARTIVRMHRSALEKGHVDGRVAGVSKTLVVLSILDEGLHPNGFNVLRLSDISELEGTAPHAEFMAKVLRLRKERLSPAPKLDLSSWRTVVETASRRFPLVTLHIEQKIPDVCYIGRPAQLTSRKGTFLTINPDGEWDWDDPLTLAWADVTRVDFGGAYEEAVALVGRETASARRARVILGR